MRFFAEQYVLHGIGIIWVGCFAMSSFFLQVSIKSEIQCIGNQLPFHTKHTRTDTNFFHHPFGHQAKLRKTKNYDAKIYKLSSYKLNTSHVLLGVTWSAKIVFSIRDLQLYWLSENNILCNAQMLKSLRSHGQTNAHGPANMAYLNEYCDDNWIYMRKCCARIVLFFVEMTQYIGFYFKFGNLA